MKTTLLKINKRKPEKYKIKKAAALIQKGSLVAFPTETVYGLGADAMNERAVKKIFKAKGRPADNPLIVHISDLRMLDTLVERVPEKAIPLIKRFWPGPLTLVMKKKKHVPDIVTAGGDTIGVRMPKHAVALALIETSGVPIAAPSANKSTYPSATEAKHVLNDLEGKIPLILDGGSTDIGIESTVLDLSEEVPTLLRKGKITKKNIEQVIGTIAEHTSKLRGKVKSPGQKYKHYAPKAMLVLVRKKTSRIKNLINNNKDIYVVTVSEKKHLYPFAKKIFLLGKINEESSAAKKFFSIVRRCDELGAKIIFVDPPMQEGVGDALYDRISRAATIIV